MYFPAKLISSCIVNFITTKLLKIQIEVRCCTLFKECLMERRKNLNSTPAGPFRGAIYFIYVHQFFCFACFAYFRK